MLYGKDATGDTGKAIGCLGDRIGKKKPNELSTNWGFGRKGKRVNTDAYTVIVLHLLRVKKLNSDNR